MGRSKLPELIDQAVNELEEMERRKLELDNELFDLKKAIEVKKVEISNLHYEASARD